MGKFIVDSDKIISRLKKFDYKYELDEKSLNIYLPMLCFLRISFVNDKIKMTSHLKIAFRSLQLEYNFLLYGVALYLLAWYEFKILNIAVFFLLGLFVIYFVICFVKIENMKVIVHNWIENDNIQQTAANS